MMQSTRRRKTARARVKLVLAETNCIRVNNKPLAAYFPFYPTRALVTQPLEALKGQATYDITIRVNGGGKHAQAQSAQIGIAYALRRLHAGYSTIAKARGFTSDPRNKERKKYGQRGARAKFQFSKR